MICYYKYGLYHHYQYEKYHLYSFAINHSQLEKNFLWKKEVREHIDINYVDKQGGGRINQMLTVLQNLMYIGNSWTSLFYWVVADRAGSRSAISWAHEKLLIFHVSNNYFHDRFNARKICVFVKSLSTQIFMKIIIFYMKYQ